MRNLFLALLFLSLCVAASGQSSSSSAPAPPQKDDSASTGKTSQHASNAEPPRSDRVNISDLGNIEGQSSSKDTQIDLSPPPDDDQAHPKSPNAAEDIPAATEGDVAEFHPWDPHKAAKDIEVGDYYFKRKNYRAAEDRYREALYYKDNDASATYHLAICLEKMNRPDEAIQQYQNYLKILPHGPDAEASTKAIERLKADSGAKAAK